VVGEGTVVTSRRRTRETVAVSDVHESGETCPRCGAASTEEFYGPCATCRTALRDAYAGDGRAIEAAEYEPKMNVTPNAVASKD
jgi:cytidine deaminase